MPKEIFSNVHVGYMILGETAGTEENLELRWSKPDGDTLGAVILGVGNGERHFIADSENVEQLDRLIAALKRARRAVLGTTTAVDMAVDQFIDE